MPNRLDPGTSPRLMTNLEFIYNNRQQTLSEYQISDLFYFICISLVFLLPSCKDTPPPADPEQEIPQSKLDTLSYMDRHVLRMLSNCEDPEDYTCTRAEVDYVLITGGVNDKVRQRINKVILENLRSDTSSIEFFLDGFLQEYQEYVDSDFEFMDEEPGWFYEGEVQVELNDPRILTLSHLEYLFTGGAHGNYDTEYWHFNCATGTSLDFDDLIDLSKMVDLEALGEIYLRKSLETDSGGGINEATGYFFPENQFYLPKVFALLPEGLTFSYHTYEIASFADGEVSFSIPYAELGQIAKAGSVLEKLTIQPPLLDKKPL